MPNATARANARTLPKVQRLQPTTGDLITNLALLPIRYAMPVVGDCLEPEICDGALLLFDAMMPYDLGDLVVVFRRPEATPEGQFQGLVKRLVMAPPPWIIFPWRDHPKSEIIPAIGLEMNNPRRSFALRCSELLGIHRCLGPVPPGAQFSTMKLASAASGEGCR